MNNCYLSSNGEKVIICYKQISFCVTVNHHTMVKPPLCIYCISSDLQQPFKNLF